MTNIDETMNKIDSLLTDGGLTSEYKEQTVRQLLYHLYIALDIYRYMTCSEKNKAGYWYRMFRSSFSLTGFLKERKRKRDKEKSPLHPSYKERETMLKEKGENNLPTDADAKEAFRKECFGFVKQYGEKQVNKFFRHWSEPDQNGRMRFQKEPFWDIETRLERWVENPYSMADENAAERKKQLQKKTATSEQQAAEREDNNARLEQEIAERKRNAVSYEEYLKMKDESNVEIGTGT